MSTPAARGWLPRPLLSSLLVAVWLLLQQSIAPGDVLVALLIGWIVPLLVRRFLVDPVLPRRPVTALRFALTVLWDIVVANVAVARIVLSPWYRPQPAWVVIPLALRDPHAITLLAAVITLTPGTVSCVIDETGWRIYVHALDCPDPADQIEQIKLRYEQPLKEIFEWHPAS
jgi:multicomponent K+:H+ antiporter subunit E